MAFPGTYNINYYQGDLYEFNIYPKNSIGAAFDLTDYSVEFWIGSARRPSVPEHECEAKIENNAISCWIPSGLGKQLTAGTTYVYDVQIKKPGSGDMNPDKVYTLLTGNITVTADVTRTSGE